MLDIVFLAALTLASVQGPPPPPPPPPMPRREVDPSLPKKGTATIKGRVLTADGRPLRRATVSATAAEMQEPRTTTTGLEGEYVLDELPAGRFTITVSRSGYLPTRYGQTRYGEPGAPLQIDNGKALEHIDFTLHRAGVISGRIVDENGEAAAGVQVWAMQSQYFRGARRLVPVSTGGIMSRPMTDDAGNYRLLGLPPGEYVVLARLRDTWMSDEKPPRMLSYAPSYFAGTANALEAQRVKVAAGQEAGAVDFALLAMPTATISGTVMRSDGMPVTSGNVSLTQEISGPTSSSMSMYGNARIGADGTFTLTDVAPGDYTVRATSTLDAGSETAVLRVTVTGNDISGLVLAADTGVPISGRVVTDTGDPLPPPVGQMTVSTAHISMDPTTNVRTKPGEDDGVVSIPAGAFTRSSATGPVVFRVSGLPRGWALKQVVIGSRDFAGLPVDIRPGQPVSGVTLVISQRLAGITGRVLDEAGKPTSGVVVVFPTDPARWHEAAATIRSGKTDQAGVFRFDMMRPGEYFVVAVDYVQQWQVNDPEFLTPLRERAMKVQLGEENVSVDVKVVR
jgi:protocatechuate 3,4-dioxygenase beta subunit